MNVSQIMDKLKKPLKWIFAILASLVGILLIMVALVYLKQDSIKKAAIDELNKHLNAPLQVNGPIEISLLKHFPLVSVEFNQLHCDGRYLSEMGPLADLQKMSLSFNFWHVLNGTYEINQLHLMGGNILIHIPVEGPPNYDIFKTDSSSEQNISLQKIIAENIEFALIIPAQKLEWRSLLQIVEIETKLESSFNEFQFTSKQFNRFYAQDSIYFLPNQEIELSAAVLWDITKQKMNLSDLLLTVENHHILADGWYFDSSKTYSFQIRNGGEELNSLLAILPESIQEKYDGWQIRGAYGLELSILKEIGKSSEIHAQLLMNNAELTNEGKKITAQISKLNVQLTHYPENPIASSLSVLPMEVRIDAHKALLSLTISDFDLPRIDLKMNGSSRLELMMGLGGTANEQGLSGDIRFSDIRIEGLLRELQKLNSPKLKCSGKIELKNASMNLDGKRLQFPKATAQFNNELLDIEQFDMHFLSSRLQFTGQLQNFLAYLLSGSKQSVVLKLNGQIRGSFNLNEWLQSDSKLNKQDDPSEIQKQIRAELKVELDQLYYKKANFSKLRMLAQWNGEALKLDAIKAFAFGGEIHETSALLIPTADKTSLRLNFSTTHLQSKDMFYQLDNFGQDALTDQSVSGWIDTKGQLRCSWNQKNELQEESVYTETDIRIKEGRLSQYEPLFAMAKYIDMEELNDIRFADLENNILISNRRIYLPEMKVKSSALDLELSGDHDFDNNINYLVKVKLKDYLAKKFKGKKQGENAEAAIDGSFTIYIKIKGTVDNPQIEVLKNTIKENLKKQFSNEKAEWKSILDKEEKKADSKEAKYFDVYEPTEFMEWEDSIR